MLKILGPDLRILKSPLKYFFFFGFEGFILFFYFVVVVVAILHHCHETAAASLRQQLSGASLNQSKLNSISKLIKRNVCFFLYCLNKTGKA